MLTGVQAHISRIWWSQQTAGVHQSKLNIQSLHLGYGLMESKVPSVIPLYAKQNIAFIDSQLIRELISKLEIIWILSIISNYSYKVLIYEIA